MAKDTRFWLKRMAMLLIVTTSSGCEADQNTIELMKLQYFSSQLCSFVNNNCKKLKEDYMRELYSFPKEDEVILSPKMTDEQLKEKIKYPGRCVTCTSWLTSDDPNLRP